MKRLTSDNKQSILLLRAKGLSYAKIAHQTGFSLGTVANVCRQAKPNLGPNEEGINSELNLLRQKNMMLKEMLFDALRH